MRIYQLHTNYEMNQRTFRHISDELVFLLSNIALIWRKGEKMQLSARFLIRTYVSVYRPYGIKNISFSS